MSEPESDSGKKLVKLNLIAKYQSVSSCFIAIASFFSLRVLFATVLLACKVKKSFFLSFASHVLNIDIPKLNMKQTVNILLRMIFKTCVYFRVEL